MNQEKGHPLQNVSTQGLQSLQKHPLIAVNSFSVVPSQLICLESSHRAIHYKISKSRNTWLAWGDPEEDWGKASVFPKSGGTMASRDKLLGYIHDFAHHQAAPCELVKDQEEEGPVELDGE